MSDASLSLRSPLKSSLLLLSLLVIVLDQWSKWAIESYLGFGRVVEVVPGFANLVHVANTGVAFGLFPANGRLFGVLMLTLLGLLALCVVGWFYLRTPSDQRLLLVALALILGGAVGNLVDRVMKGSVTDFIDVYVATYHWPTFNVADSAITVGIVLLAWETFRPHRSPASAPGNRLASTE